MPQTRKMASPVKEALALQIKEAVEQQRLTQHEAAAVMGLPQPKVSGVLRGIEVDVSERKLMDCLVRLGFDIKIIVAPAAETVGRLQLARA